MNDFSRLYIISNCKGAGNPFYGRSSLTSGVIISLRDEKMDISVKFGCCPTSGEVNTLVGIFLKEYIEIMGPVEVYKRMNRYRFIFKAGSSGCQDTFIEVDTNDGFPKRKMMFHGSMCSKMNMGVNCFIYDFLDLCVSENFLQIIEGNYFYDLENDQNAQQMTIRIISPRSVNKEIGWNNPGEYGKVKNIFEEGVIVKGE